jgi:hypothetical protein
MLVMEPRDMRWNRSLSEFVVHGFACLTASVAAMASVLPLRAEELAKGAVVRMSDDLRYLASDELEGRNVGTEGIAKAGEYIVQRFEELGLETKLFDGSPYQEFTIPGPPGLGPADKNWLSVTGENVPVDQPEFRLGENFTALTLGSSGQFEGPLVFAGYGITAEDLDYDDYAGLDVTGKVVVVLRKEPQQNDPNSRFDGTRNSQYAYFASKQANAAVHNVAAMILVNDAGTLDSAGDGLLPPDGAGTAITDHRVPTYFALRSAIEPLIQAGLGKSLDELEAQIDQTGQPASAELRGITAGGETAIEDQDIPVRNVVGLLPGSGTLADEYVVIGAHYDHVGMGGPGSLAPGTIAIHNGADDNASGTTAMLEVARRLAGMPAENRRNLVFMAFTAEEKGLLGSKHYVRNPRFPLEQTVAMLNMDMVGRLNDNTLTVYGIGTAEGFGALIDEQNKRTAFNLDKQVAGYGPSDHSSFYEVGIPVFHFFTGLHNEYHRPSDDFELINFDGMARIADMVTGAAQEISIRPDRPKPLKVEGYADVGRNRVRSGPARSRPVMGVQLDGSLEDQARIVSLSDGGPAAAAGLQPGDRIVKVGESEVVTTVELQAAIGRYRVGDAVPIVVDRDGETIQVDVTLGEG